MARTGGFLSCLLPAVLAVATWPAVAIAAPAAPLDPVEAIVDAFDDYQIVALGEGNHGNLPGHAFRLQLLRDPRFLAQVQDIVVEFGNSRYQDVIDRYVAGEDVPADELRRVWRDTAQANPVWDVPIYEEFFRAVRDVNAGLPAEKRLRVVLGDVPFDWSAVRTVADYNRQPQRNDLASSAIIRREVIAKGRKALVVFGDMHFLREQLPFDGTGTRPQARSIVAILEAENVRVFSIYTNSFVDPATLQPDVATWQPPRIALLQGTPLGGAPFVTFQPVSVIVDGQRVPVDPALSPTMEEQFDALLYLGPPSAMRSSLPAPALCQDQAYLDTRFFRMTLVGMGAQVEQAKQYCRMVGAPAAGQ